MFLDILMKDKPVLDEGYDSMAEELDFLFDRENLDFATALSVFFLSYGMENVKWELMPARSLVREPRLTGVLQDISREIKALCWDVSDDPKFEEFVSSLKTRTALYERYDVARALTRAASILYVCGKYKDRVDYVRASSVLGRYEQLSGHYAEEVKATMAILMICSFLKFGGLRIPNEDGFEVTYRYFIKSPAWIYNVVLRDMNRRSSGKDWFAENTGKLMRGVCREYARENRNLQRYGERYYNHFEESKEGEDEM